MSAVVYDIDANAKNLVEAFEASIRKSVELESQLSTLTSKVDKLEKANKKLGDASKKTGADLGALAQGAGVLSGGLSEAVRGVDDLGKGAEALSEVFGATKVATAGVVAAFAAMAVGTGLVIAKAFELTSAAVIASGRLEKMGLASIMPAGAKASLDQYNAAQGTLQVALDQLLVTFGAELAPTLTELIQNFTILSTSVVANKDAIVDLVDEWVGWMDVTNPWFAVLHGLWGVATADVEGYTEAVASLNAAPLNFDGPNWTDFKVGAMTLQEIVAIYEKLTADRLAGEAAAAAAAAKTKAEYEAANKAFGESIEAGTKVQLAAFKATADAGRKFNAERQAEQDKWIAKKQTDDAKMLADEEAARKARKAAADKEAAEEEARQNKIKAGILQGVTGTLQAIVDIAAANATARLAEADADLDRSNDKEKMYQDQLRQGHDLTAAQRKDIQDKIKAEQDLQKNIRDERKKAANAAKAAAIGQAIIGGALAIVQCFAQLGPIGGAIAAVPVGIATAAEVATIKKQKFHDGGPMNGPDEFDAGDGRTGRKGEEAFVFNQGAKESGAVEAAKAWNRGQAPVAQGSQGAVLVMDGRVIGEAIVREKRKAGSPLAAGSGDGVTNPFRGGR